MTIEERLSEHYRGISTDPWAEAHLRSLVDSLGTPNRRPLRGPRIATVLAVAVVAGCAALVVALVPDGSGGDVASPPTPSASPSSHVSSSPNMLRNRPGWTLVEANTSSFYLRMGWARNSELNGIDLMPTSPTQAVASQKLRGADVSSVPAYAEPRDGSQVIGWFTSGRGDLHSTCPGGRGLVFTLTPPADAIGARTPLGAARSIRTRYLIGNYGSATSPWRTSATSATAATVSAGPITLHLRRQGNGTWVIVSGQTCLS